MRWRRWMMLVDALEEMVEAGECAGGDA